MHDLGHLCVMQEKGSCEREDILRRETVRAECGGQVCGDGARPGFGVLALRGALEVAGVSVFVSALQGVLQGVFDVERGGRVAVTV